MRIIGTLLALALWTLPDQAALADPPPFQVFQERCAEKTDVYATGNGELFQVGERIDEYCAGFLEGLLALLEDEERVCPDRGARTADYLLSVVNFYVKDKPSEGLNASAAVTQAFKRALPCENE